VVCKLSIITVSKAKKENSLLKLRPWSWRLYESTKHKYHIKPKRSEPFHSSRFQLMVRFPKKLLHQSKCI